MMSILNMVLFVLSVPLTLVSLYLLYLTLLSREIPVTLRSSRRMRFDIVVPAHNEAMTIEGVVKNLRKIDWPDDAYRILVVADNCTDATTELARSAGAEVLVRNDPNKRGKGYALEFAFQQSLSHGWAYAIMVVDADSEVSENILESFSNRIEHGAKAIQSHYDVLNVQASWRTRLMSIALASFHQLRSRARERLKLSCGIRGNGWCITHRLLQQVPYRAYSLAEDIEYGIDIGLAGYRVYYADEAKVSALMVSGEQAAGIQRKRWEDGRFQLIRSKLLPLLRSSFNSGGRVCLDLALDLLVVPVSYIVINAIVLIVLAGMLSIWIPSLELWLWLGLFSAASIFIYIMRGWQLSKLGMQGLMDLLRAPFFVAWKVLLILRSNRTVEWVRTKREQS